MKSSDRLNEPARYRNGSARIRIGRVTRDVMNVYKRVNPSRVERMDSRAAWNKYRETWKRLLVRKLMIPPAVFKDARLLDAGCGSGEKSLVYASLGAHVSGYDANEKAIRMARERAKTLGLAKNASFTAKSVFSLRLRSAFDIVVSDGMLHHTADPRRGFDRIAAALTPGGILILGLAEPHGFFQRRLQRFLVHHIVGLPGTAYSEQEKVRVAKLLFGPGYERASRISGRSLDSAIYDTFINPQIVPISVAQVESWLTDHGIHLDCSWPPIALPLQADSQYHPDLPSDLADQKSWRTVVRAVWLLNNEPDRTTFERAWPLAARRARAAMEALPSAVTDRRVDRKKILAAIRCADDLPTSPIPAHDVRRDLKIFLTELIDCCRRIENARAAGKSPIEIASNLRFKRLFAGYHGVGMVYYRGTKEE